MVLLDFEGIDAAKSKGQDDNQIFTLTVLLASVLIYNSQGVPTRRDLEGLEYPFYIVGITEMKRPRVISRNVHLEPGQAFSFYTFSFGG